MQNGVAMSDKILGILILSVVIIFHAFYWLEVFNWGLGAIIMVTGLACFLLLGEIGE